MKLKIIIYILVLVFPVLVGAYNINSGDVMHLEVYGEPELALDVKVDDSGFIEYPFVGKIKVSGIPLEVVKKDIVASLKDGYFINPQVTIFIKEYKPFFIEGEVKSPGSYAFEVGLTVRRAISLAGGLTERASKKKMYLISASDNSQAEIKVTMDQKIASGDVLQIKESFF